MRGQWFLIASFLGVLAACDSNTAPASSPGKAGHAAATIPIAEPSIATTAATPITDNPHPSEMATHCLRVLGALAEGPQVERCQSLRLWAVASDGRASLSDNCLLHRLTFEAYLLAKEMALIPRGSPGAYQNQMDLNDCNVAGEGINLAPFVYADANTETENKLAFISFALRAIGEDRKWSIVSQIHSTDLAAMCTAFEVATDEAIKRQAKEDLGCYLW